ncbi:hypothetical protein GPECTOR_67g334 [Gonium pectorale]|uniref:Uncharacterized protein n=1 Tax=Gonium pectorale TaxID=33097 RepID=A0A150G3Y9_GONPE|nr:hypothetical protein GPECTOR_67g334 [Gonium pectorale]|eukprot:KXZ44493.1 hypothetical protein GPECTOR_67g334 [Gonium pectorale]
MGEGDKGSPGVEDVERQQPDEKASVAKQDAAPKSPKDSAFKRFMAGPYFDVIPPEFERIPNAKRAAKVKEEAGAAQNAPQEAPPVDYLGRLKAIAMNPVDVDGVYGLTQEELVPLPFDIPKWHAYLVDILLGTYQVAQATIVMFISIYVENQERAWKDGNGYTRSWLPLVKALIIVYPLVTLIIMVSLTLEYSMRRFMYYRLLSMRILVDWKNIKPWNSVFFFYFIGTWVLMNAWAIYGLAKYYNKDGNDTVQLLIYYMKLLSTESRLVSLNQIFERAPVEAQRLLEFTYVIEEEELIKECYDFAAFNQRAFVFRLVNLLTCGLMYKDWANSGKDIKFDIERLKRSAPNREAVEANVDQALGRPPKEERKPADHDQVVVEERGEPEPMVTCCPCWRPVWWAYTNAYASLHSLNCSVLVHYKTWPFRPDIAMLTLIQILGILAVGAIVVLGWQFSTRESNCTKSAKTCSTCLAVHERYFASAEPLCSTMESVIARIVASTNGTWLSNGVREERYCNWACYGNFTPTPPGMSCPAQTYEGNAVTDETLHPFFVKERDLRKRFLFTAGLAERADNDTAVFYLAFSRLTYIKDALKRGELSAAPKPVDLTGKDFVVLVGYGPGAAHEEPAPDHIAVIAQCGRLAADSLEEADAIAAMFVSAEEGKVFKAQRRGPRKTAKGALPLKTAGMTYNAFNPDATGWYAHLRNMPGLQASFRALLARVTATLRRLFPAAMNDLDRYHGRQTYFGSTDTGGFCTMSLARDYFNMLHLDDRDPPISFVTWWLTGEGSLLGGAFVLASLGITFTPLHGTALCLNTKQVYHGTAPVLAGVGAGGVQRMGSAVWHRRAVIEKMMTARKKKLPPFSEDAAGHIKGTDIWGWRRCPLPSSPPPKEDGSAAVT